MTMKMTRCKVQCSLKLSVQAHKPDNKIRFSVFSEVFNKLMDICQINLSITTDDWILENVLELDLLRLSYDTQNNKLINIDVILI